MQMELATLSRRGGRNYNEDACGHWHSDSQLCCVVADGAGGHGGGDKASKIAVQFILGGFAASPDGGGEAIQRLIVDTNRSIIQHRADDRALQNMHSTVVALFIDLERHVGSWGHCGDSRLYVFRGGRISTRTRDHSLVQSLVDGGMLAAADMRSHPQRSELLSALGVGEEDLQVSVPERSWQLEAGDVFLLCTDGVWEFVEDDQLELALASSASPLAWLHELERNVLHGAAHKPRHDNFTALAVWVSGL
ncbi:MAG: protein phosphatase 2C domain-containing protein [Caldimonas sp.]